jgi:ferric-dicitrate binding protein FerR (iron transport regulator)
MTKRLWADTEEAALIPVDTDKAWQNVSSKTIEKQAKIVSLFPWRKALAIAASVILILSVLYYFNRPSDIEWNVTLAENSNTKIQLTDSSVITLRKGSRLSVPENYGKQIREVRLEGEAYFEIKHDTEKPFSITTSKSIIKDIGTSFLVQSTGSLEQVTVLEGVVSFAGKKKNKTPLVLKAGESAVLKNENIQKEKADTINLLSWRSNILVFHNTPLSQVVKDLKNYYLINVALPDSMDSVQITAEFKNESLAQVIKELRLLTSLQLQMKENTLFISK